MRKITVSILVVVALLSLAVAAYAATPGGPFSSAFRVQNVSATTANCVYTFYKADGSVGYTSAGSSINAGDSLYVYVPSVAGLASGEYSGVVSCDQDVAAVVNWSDANSGASFEGVGSADTATTLYAPGIYDNYYNFYSNIYVQNATSSAVDVSVEIYAPGSAVPILTQAFAALPANSAHMFEQAGTALVNGVPYSAKIVATGNVAAIVNIYGGVGSSVDNQLYSYNAFKGGSTTAYAPVIMNNYYGYNTALAIQNLGATTAPYTVTYGSGHVQTGNVAGNSSVSLYSPASGIPAGNALGLNSAKVESAQPVVVLVNESNNFNRAASYAGFAAGNTIARAPIVMRAYYNFNTSVQCQNLGAVAATMTIDYANTATNTTSPSIAAGKTHLFYQPTDPNMPSGNTNGITSATITSAQPIACIVNQDTNEPPYVTQVLDNLFAYEGITR
jgi:hypothetical protein